ncbi:eCIS core domain-containing protein [Streptomyces sp. NPDC004262]
MRSRSEQSDGGAPGARQRASAPVPPAPRPLTSAELTSLQRLADPGVVARDAGPDRHVHGSGCGHDGGEGADPAAQSALLASAISSPSRPLSGALRAEADSFYRNDFSSARIHDNHVAQRATEALGAQAMTVGAHVFLGPGMAGNKEVMGHELGHVDKNLRGVRETGADNGAGLSVTDPGQDSERTAAADGAAFAAGARTAPSAGAGGHGAAPAGTVQRSAAGPALARMRSLQGTAGNHAVARLLAPGTAPVQRMGKDDKKKTPRQTAKDIDEAVKEKWKKAYGGGRHGQGPDQVRRRYARSMEDDETSQTLSHQAFLVYDAVAGVQEEQGAKDDREREVQGMLINNRLLFASNYNESMDALKGFTTDGSKDGYADLVSTHQSTAGRERGMAGPDAREYSDRVNRADVKTQAVMAGQRGGADDATAETLRKRYGKPVALVDVSDRHLHTLLTSEQFEGSIFLLTFKEEKALLHAEQKLLLALHRSGIKPKEVRGQHAIMGRYRGCLCCTAALEYYRSKAGFGNLDFDPNPGFYYWESLENLYRHQAHVVNDPDFKRYMLHLASQMPATPALSRMQPPGDAYENNGPESVVDAGLASRRNYRTPSLSDIEMDTDEHGKPVFSSYTREQDIAGTEAGAARVGQGSDQIKSRLRADRIITDPAHRRQIQDTWLHGTPEDKKNLFKYWEETARASRPELAEIIHEVDGERSMEGIKSALYRYVKDRTGHEARDGREAGAPVTRRPDKGKYADKKADSGKKKSSKPSRKSMNEKSSGWSTIKSVMEGDDYFRSEWRRREKGKEKSHIEPRYMPEALAQTVAALSNEYTVSSMARMLHMAERSLTRLVNSVEAANVPDGQASGPVYDDDVPMSGTGGGASQGGYSRTLTAPSAARTYAIADVGTSTGTAQYPDFPGYTRQVDSIGQVTYIDDETGSVSIWDEDAQRLVVIREPVQQSEMDWSYS